MPSKTCVNCSRGCGDFCLKYQRHVDDQKDRSDCKEYKRIGSGKPEVLFDQGTPYLYKSDNPTLEEKLKKRRL